MKLRPWEEYARGEMIAMVGSRRRGPNKPLVIVLEIVKGGGRLEIDHSYPMPPISPLPREEDGSYLAEIQLTNSKLHPTVIVVDPGRYREEMTRDELYVYMKSVLMRRDLDRHELSTFHTVVGDVISMMPDPRCIRRARDESI